MQGKTTFSSYFENPVITKNGDIRIVRWHNSELKDNSGRLIGALSSGEDITEQKKAEQILRENEEKYRELANSLPDIVFETDHYWKTYCMLMTELLRLRVTLLKILKMD